MTLLRTAALVAALAGLAAAAQPNKPVTTAKPAMAVPSSTKSAESTKPTKYAVGQVWEYRTRPQDAGSLLKIQKIEPYGRGQVYHISIIGLKFSTPGIQRELPHVPISARALDASVTKESPVLAGFPPTPMKELACGNARRAASSRFPCPGSWM